ncbi:hypothetical protein AYK24_09300 [Thermoplasmatales archaeon SG8-52-4]|nr:MAG: hypothetical protein AYK24_09300 [Thermoplasmatales archaeon SG8-52-4]
MNYASFIVKIIGKPEQSFFENDISVTEVLVKLCQIRNKKLEITLRLSLWGNLAYDTIQQYYQINAYIIVEGYISLRENISDSYRIPIDKQVEISVFKIYPFLLNNIRITEIEK